MVAPYFAQQNSTISQKTPSPLKEIIDNFSGELVVTDPAAIIVYANKRLRDVTGYSPAEAVGKNPGKLWGGRMDKSFYERLWHRIKHDELPFVAEVKNTKKSGAVYHETMHIAPIVNAEGELKFFIKLQPGAQSNLSVAAFDHGFISSLEHQHDASWQAVEFFLRTFGISQQAWQTQNATSGNQPDPRDQIVAFLESVLVAPTKELYRERGADRTLVAAGQTDHAAFDKIYAKYYKPVRNYFLGRVSYNQETAEDLAQETFVQAFRHLPEFTVSNASYLTYLMHIAHNLLVSHYRKRRYTLVDNEVLAGTNAAPPIDFAKIFDLEHVWQAVGNLESVEQKILKLKYQDDSPVSEIAQKVGKSENAVKLHLSRARKKVRKMLGVSD